MSSLIFSSNTLANTAMMVMSVVDRFELQFRQSCPQPYADADDSLVLPCEPGLVQSVMKSLVYSCIVDHLIPYTKYEFLLSVDNEFGTLPQPVSTFATTLQAGIVYWLFDHDTLQLVLWPRVCRSAKM